MKTFTDNAGRDWQVAVDVAAVKRVRGMCDGLDLITAIEGTLFHQLSADPVLLVDVLYAVCKPQADERGVTDQQFGAAMAGDAIDKATDALLEEICDFFRSGRRTVLKTGLQKLRAAETLAMSQAVAKVQEIDVADLMRQAAGDSSTSSPASSVSTPAA